MLLCCILDVYLSFLLVCTESLTLVFDPTSSRFIRWLLFQTFICIYAVLAVDDRHVAFCEYNGSVARIICVAVATLPNEKLLERASDNDLLLCRKSSRIKRVIDNDLIDV
jgi:hypothetical protein